PKRNIEGTVVDVSVKGALIKLDNSTHFNKEEMVNLKLYYNKLISDKEEINIVNVSGQIKRVAKEKQELAIVFIKDDSVKKCANI
ncbi:MAG: PilZ domain-containing protein, partial [Syntrophobacteria bacterium]